jgi:hypothetical protein
MNDENSSHRGDRSVRRSQLGFNWRSLEPVDRARYAVRQFRAFSSFSPPEHIPTNVLSSRLKLLESSGLLEATLTNGTLRASPIR